jgi:hypothetical protein
VAGGLIEQRTIGRPIVSGVGLEGNNFDRRVDLKGTRAVVAVALDRTFPPGR